MRNEFLSSVTALLFGTGLAMAQTPPATMTLADGAIPVTTPVSQAPVESLSKAGAADAGPISLSGRLYGGIEFLAWTTKNDRLPPLATSTSIGGTGIIGDIDTKVILGGSDVDFHEQYGGRFTLGGWVNCGRTLGVEGSYFFLTQSSRRQAVTIIVPRTSFLVIVIQHLLGFRFIS